VRLAKTLVHFLTQSIQGLEHSLGVGNQLVDYLALPVRPGGFLVGSPPQAEAVQLGYVLLGVSN
jgi:hypothetical protein